MPLMLPVVKFKFCILFYSLAILFQNFFVHWCVFFSPPEIAKCRNEAPERCAMFTLLDTLFVSPEFPDFEKPSQS